MQNSNQGQRLSLNLVQAENEEEGVESEVPPDMGGNLMIRRSMVILEKEQSKVATMNMCGFEQLFSNQVNFWRKGISIYC